MKAKTPFSTMPSKQVQKQNQILTLMLATEATRENKKCSDVRSDWSKINMQKLLEFMGYLLLHYLAGQLVSKIWKLTKKIILFYTVLQVKDFHKLYRVYQLILEIFCQHIFAKLVHEKIIYKNWKFCAIQTAIHVVEKYKQRISHKKKELHCYGHSIITFFSLVEN